MKDVSKRDLVGKKLELRFLDLIKKGFSPEISCSSVLGDFGLRDKGL